MILLALGSLTYHAGQRSVNIEKYSYGGRMKEYHARSKQRQNAFSEQAEPDKDDKPNDKSTKYKYYSQLRQHYRGAMGERGKLSTPADEA